MSFLWIQGNPFYTERAKLRRKWIKLSIGADVLKQIICTIKMRRAPTKHDNIDFKSIITRTSDIKPLSIVVVADKGYDSEENHVLVREGLKTYCIIAPRYLQVPIWRTNGRFRLLLLELFQNLQRTYSWMKYYNNEIESYRGITLDVAYWISHRPKNNLHI